MLSSNSHAVSRILHFGVISEFLNFFFPSRCPVCNERSDDHSHNPLCFRCWSAITKYEGPACAICGLPTVSPYTKICGECLDNKPPFDKIRYFGIYEGPLKESIHLLKFQGVKRLSIPLAGLIYSLLTDKYDAIIPVPLHTSKLREREFNQTALLGHHLSKALSSPLLMNALCKNHETKLQTDVSGKERRDNLSGAFSASKEISGASILLVDDVITTGATVAECSKVLKKAGALKIDVAALARSMPRINT